MAIVPTMFPDRKGYDGSCDEYEIHDHEDRLELAHDFGHDGSKGGMA